MSGQIAARVNGLRRWLEEQRWDFRDGGVRGYLLVILLVGTEALVVLVLISGRVPYIVGVVLVTAPYGAYLLAQPATRSVRTLALLIGAALVLGLASQTHGLLRSALVILGAGSVLMAFAFGDRFLSVLPPADRAFDLALSRIRTTSKRARETASTFDGIAAANTDAIEQLQQLDPPAAEWVPARNLAIAYYRKRLDLLEGRIPADEQAAPMLEAEWDKVRTAWAAALKARSKGW